VPQGCMHMLNFFKALLSAHTEREIRASPGDSRPTPSATAIWLSAIQALPIITAQQFVRTYKDIGSSAGNQIFNNQRFVVRGIFSGFWTEDGSELILALEGNKGVSAYVDEPSVPQIKTLRPHEAVTLLCQVIQENSFGRVELRDCMFMHEAMLTCTVAHFLWKDYMVWKTNKSLSSTNWDNQRPPPYVPAP
jgi:hypothetical protein